MRYSQADGFSVVQHYYQNQWSFPQETLISGLVTKHNGFIQVNVSKLQYRSTEEVKGAAQNVFTEIISPMFCLMSDRKSRSVIWYCENDVVVT